jgi:hypothetical protein
MTLLYRFINPHANLNLSITVNTGSLSEAKGHNENPKANEC